MTEKICEFKGIPAGLKKIEFLKIVLYIIAAGIAFVYGSSEESKGYIACGIVLMIVVFVLTVILSIRASNKVVIYTDKIVIIAGSEGSGNGMTINASLLYNKILSVEIVKAGGLIYKREKMKITDTDGKEYIFFIEKPNEVKEAIERQKNG